MDFDRSSNAAQKLRMMKGTSGHPRRIIQSACHSGGGAKEIVKAFLNYKVLYELLIGASFFNEPFPCVYKLRCLQQTVLLATAGVGAEIFLHKSNRHDLAIHLLHAHEAKYDKGNKKMTQKGCMMQLYIHTLNYILFFQISMSSLQ